MAHPLTRLLCLRMLVEETSRMELEGRAALAARIEGERGEELRAARAGRDLAVESICERSEREAQSAERAAGWRAVDRALEREKQLGELAQVVEQSVMQSRAVFVERRKERRQVETVLNAAEQQARAEQERKLQRELDDWFGMKPSRMRRGRLRKGQS